MRGMLLGFVRVSWSDHVSELLDCIFSNDFHSSDDVALHEVGQVGEESFSSMFSIEVIGELWPAKPTHFKFGNFETVLINCVNDLARLSVTVWLNHSKGFL